MEGESKESQGLDSDEDLTKAVTGRRGESREQLAADVSRRRNAKEIIGNDEFETKTGKLYRRFSS